ncbi:hypothetical protein TRFO_06478 [Tritrichomonas foetus]|uniref:Uncharacterized protein n=1 Tax=Tritrichomonas foetus TaxID=1144522 RepID=A0A1J4K096_9EUKA|nr:hypothetical protein TRFO_06478 [Tritrichomonas foetus]|eukprot:OHT04152.1 hypothetical protein TRFO_06478 [Tritrichomonas foetus]
MGEEDQFSSFLEKYSEYLTDTSNKEDLLQFGRHLFSASSGNADNRESIRLLKEKEEELSVPVDKNDSRSKTFSKGRPTRNRVDPPQNLSPDQITQEILTLQDQGQQLRKQKKELEVRLQNFQDQYEAMIKSSIETKKTLRKQTKLLTQELAASLLREGTNVATTTTTNVPRILPVMNELERLNQQILQKIGSFRETTKDALAHCERAALDRYKPRMEELLGKIYENARDIPVDEIQRRFDATSDDLESQIINLQNELEIENDRNEKLQFDTRQLEDRVSAQKDEVMRMKKQHTQLGHEITILNDIAVQEISALKAQYQRLLQDQEDERARPSSARAVIITGKGPKEIKRAKIKRQPSKAPLTSLELKNPQVPSIEDFIDQEKAMLLERIHNSQYV